MSEEERPDDRRVTAAVLVIGDEILSGRTQDVNVNAIARYVAVHGVDLAEVRIVPDVHEEIVDALNALRTKYDYVLTTGGIGPTHDDITADAVAAAFGVALNEDPEIVAAMVARFGSDPDSGGSVNAARRRMARIPEGGFKIVNPVQGPPGFGIGNVFVMAGVPAIMRGMLQDVGWRLKGGRPTLSKTLKVVGSGEGVLAAPLERVAKAHPALSLGSYPFFGPDGYGAQLVIRGRDMAEIEAAFSELAEALKAAGVNDIAPVEG